MIVMFLHLGVVVKFTRKKKLSIHKKLVPRNYNFICAFSISVAKNTSGTVFFKNYPGLDA